MEEITIKNDKIIIKDNSINQLYYIQISETYLSLKLDNSISSEIFSFISSKWINNLNIFLKWTPNINMSTYFNKREFVLFELKLINMTTSFTKNINDTYNFFKINNSVSGNIHYTFEIINKDYLDERKVKIKSLLK